MRGKKKDEVKADSKAAGERRALLARLADFITNYLIRDVGCVKAVHVGGSLGRGDENPNDIDLAVVTDGTYCSADVMRGVPGVTKVGACGRSHCRVYFGNEKVDAWFGMPESEGALKLHVEGPKSFAIAMRQAAKRVGMTLSQHGLVDEKTGEVIESRDLGAILRAIGMGRFEDASKRRKRFKGR